ncbi:histidinol-phosphate aminotransferase family protein [Candidatus Gottesmanbacteria bacterium]|nr:histidinol-phosphate aminotransferase family protein [Candidatus Gottesmanbacteria bacterium]
MFNLITINLQYTTIKDPLPDFIYEGLREYSSGANLYRPQPDVLVEKLAKKHHVPKEMIYLTAGIDEAIQMFAHAYGNHAYVFTPTYIVYTDVEEFGGKLTRIPSIKKEEYIIDPSKKADATLIYLANPNNPSGFTEKSVVMKLVENNNHTIVVIDEAYGEFTDLSVIDQVKKYPHMAVLRSFSKAYGMAGNRIGYIIAHKQIINVVKNKSQWANVSYLSVGAAIAALDHEKYFTNMRMLLNNRRDDFIKFLKTQGYHVILSRINAVLLQFSSDKEAEKFVNHLRENNIIVSPGNGASNIGLDSTFVRIAIGNKEQMDTLKKFLSP